MSLEREIRLCRGHGKGENMDAIIRQLAAIKSSLDWIGIVLGSIFGVIFVYAVYLRDR